MFSGGGMGFGGMYETRGGEPEMHIYDFDETIARAETPIPYEVKSPDGNIIEKGKTTSVEFEKKKEELENDYDKGVKIDYNFDAFKKLITDATLNNANEAVHYIKFKQTEGLKVEVFDFIDAAETSGVKYTFNNVILDSVTPSFANKQATRASVSWKCNDWSLSGV